MPGHCYPEFYLEDDKGEGHWFPCQSAGTREFGGITEFGRSCRRATTSARRRTASERQRYMAEYLTGTPYARRRRAAGDVHPRRSGKVVFPGAARAVADELATILPRRGV